MEDSQVVRKRTTKKTVVTQTRTPSKPMPTSQKKNSMSKAFIFIVALVAIFQAAALLLIFYPSPITPLSFNVTAPPVFEGPLAVNDLLQTKTRRVLEGEFIGPESLAVRGDFLYTGTLNKGVIRIHLPTLAIVELPALGEPPCGSYEQEPVCGRPLGLRIVKDFLYVIDAYLGLFKYDLNNENKPAKKLLDGFTFGNDIAISSDGLIYITDSSKIWQRRNAMYLLLESPTDGRLIEFDEKTGKTKTLKSDLVFANGVELSPKEDYLLVAETNLARIARYWLKGPKAGTWDYFNSNLPGLPDNIRKTPRNTYWVGLAGIRTGNPLSYLEPGQYPFVKSMAAKIFSISPHLFYALIPHHGLVIEMDQQGSIVRSLHDPTGGVVPSISEIEESANGTLYLGSFLLPYLTVFDTKN